MDDKQYTELAVRIQEVDSRSKSNEHRLDCIDKDIDEIRTKQEAIYDLTSSVKSIAQDMSYIKKDVSEVKNKQEELNNKVTVLENKPAVETKRKVDLVYEKIIWIIASGIVGFILAQALPGIF